MLRLHKHLWPWPLLLGLGWCALLQAEQADAPVADPGAFLARAESIRTMDHPQFVRMLEQIHRQAPRLTAAEQWHLRYLDAWETMFQGDYRNSETQLHEVIEHAGDPSLAAKATALLLSNLGTNRRYDEAFALANRVTAELPNIKDTEARLALIQNLSQMFNLAGQTDLAIHYAQMQEDALPPGRTRCQPYYMQVAALYNGKRLSTTSSELRRAIDTCTAARQPVVANALWLILGSLYLEQNRAAEALALLNRIDPDIRATQYHPHQLSSQVQRAQAHEKLGHESEAKQAALAAVALAGPGEINEWLKEAYEVLYRVEKKRGNAEAALSYYERFVAQDKSNLDDISARAIAYETSRQHNLMQKMETESLSKQNHILRLQQALAGKAVETGRLYIALLLVGLVSIVFWLFRTKRSQLRFKRLSRLDGLTGILNHQHFVAEAEHSLRLSEKKRGVACLICIDLDHFKQINDTHGHAVGDEVLRHTVALCGCRLPTGDLFGRLGGEEFSILLLDCPRDRGVAIAESIRQSIEATPFHDDGHAVSLSASVGVACTDNSGHSLQRLCRDADAALYRAKRGGRNRVVADGDDSGALVA